MSIVFSKHALEQMRVRGISRQSVIETLEHPDKIIENDDTVTYQKVIDDGVHLLRVILNPYTDPLKVITLYRTSKINKYS